MSLPSLAVILLNYARPQNIGPIASAVAEGLPRVPIFVLDHAPTDELRSRDDIPWNRIWYRKPRVNGRAGARIRLAVELPFDHYIAIDDDVLIGPQQVRLLRRALIAQPDRAHGLGGRLLWCDENRRIYRDTDVHFGPVDLIHMVYAYSRDTAQRTIELALEVGYPSWANVRYGDDILLCSSSDEHPVAHKFGRVEFCPTAGAEGIAISTEPKFMRHRAGLMRRLRDMGRLKIQPEPPEASPRRGPESKLVKLA